MLVLLPLLGNPKIGLIPAVAMVRTGKKRKKFTTSRSAPRTSFSSLPNDIALNIFARISRIHYPLLSLVSKSFSSLLSSRELSFTRNLLENTEKCFYLCLKLPLNKDKPRWFTLSEQEKLVPIPLFPYEHPSSPTVVSNGSDIYIIGGYIKKRRSRYVFLLDCRSHKWCKLPNMLFPRGDAVACLIEGKIYVFGGCYTPCNENWGEIYDPKSESWELLSSTEFTPNLLFQKSVKRTDCFLGEEKIWCKASVCSNNYDLIWCDLEDDLGWRKVNGLEGLHKVSPDFISVVNSSVGGRRVTIMWVYKIYHPSSGSGFVCHVEIWCAEILLERISREELFGTVEWSKMICTTDNTKSGCGRLGHGVCLATITH